MRHFPKPGTGTVYETFDHTADIGLRARSDQLDTLFEEAACALFSVLVANLDAVNPVQEFNLHVKADRLDDLLCDWLAELLYTFETERVVLGRFDVKIDGDVLTATAWGEPIDDMRHELDMDVKAITYHGLKVEEHADGWLAEVIVDL